MEHSDYDISWPEWEVVPNGQNMPIQSALPSDKSSDAPDKGKKEDSKNDTKEEDDATDEKSTSYKVRGLLIP
jgi:hypothetical protein